MVDAVDRKGSECIGLGVTGITNLFGGMEQIVFVFEFCHPTASLRGPGLFIRFKFLFAVIHFNRRLRWYSKDSLAGSMRMPNVFRFLALQLRQDFRLLVFGVVRGGHHTFDF